MLTVATQVKRVDIDLGVIENEGGLITDYREKPSLHYQVSMGIYVYEPRVLDYLPAGSCQFPDLVLRLPGQEFHRPIIHQLENRRPAILP